jgi:hypothetical protein
MFKCILVIVFEKATTLFSTFAQNFLGESDKSTEKNYNISSALFFHFSVLSFFLF